MTDGSEFDPNTLCPFCGKKYPFWEYHSCLKKREAYTKLQMEGMRNSHGAKPKSSYKRQYLLLQRAWVLARQVLSGSKSHG